MTDLSKGRLSVKEEAARVTGLEERIAAEEAELRRRTDGKVSPGPRGVQYVFIMGCPRSGTTALATLLNYDARFLIGQERFRLIRGLVEPFHFEEKVFFNPTLQETSWAMPWRNELVYPGRPADYVKLRERWKAGRVQIVGDKAPYYYRELERLSSVFPRPRFVLLLRDLREVATSYLRRARNPEDHWPLENGHELALEDWNESLRVTRAFAEAGGADRLLVVDYTRFYGGEEGELARLLAFLDVDSSAELQHAYERLLARGIAPADLSDDEETALEAGRDHEAEAWARGQAASSKDS